MRAHLSAWIYALGTTHVSLRAWQAQVTLYIPKLRRLSFETAIIERYHRRGAFVEEALVEIYLAGVSVRRVEDITEVLWATQVKLKHDIAAQSEDLPTVAWCNQQIAGEYPYLDLDGMVFKRG